MPTTPASYRIVELLGRHLADLHQSDLLEIAADAYQRGSWDLVTRRPIVEAICRLALSLSDQLADSLADDPGGVAGAALSRQLIAELTQKVGRLEAKLAEYETQSSSVTPAVD